MKYVTTIERMAEARGKEDGKIEGKIEGRIEEKQAIALNMLQKHMSLETIAEVTGLEIEQVQALQAQLEQG
jgi:predicted transposase/invertase (TIGR01784 family)